MSPHHYSRPFFICIVIIVVVVAMVISFTIISYRNLAQRLVGSPSSHDTNICRKEISSNLSESIIMLRVCVCLAYLCVCH